MKLAAALAVMLAAPAAQSAELKMFRERNFRGAMMVLNEASSSISHSPRAIRVGDGGTWLICPRPFFGGQCKTVDKDVADLRLPRAFSGTVKSARPVATTAPPPIVSEPPAPARPSARPPAAEVSEPPKPSEKPEPPKA